MRQAFTQVGLGLVLLGVSSPMWSQADPSMATAPPVDTPMVAPAPVSGGGYSMDYASETPRTNYLRGGLNFGATYDDGVQPLTAGPGVSDVSYSVSPTIALDQTRSRFHWNLGYSPGFVFYQKYSSLNQFNQNLATQFSYRWTPHVTFSAQEVFSKTLGGNPESCGTVTTATCGALSSPNNSIISPTTDTLNDATSAQLTYQFSPGGMVGVTGNFSLLSYPDQTSTTGQGLYGSSTTGGSGYYTHRLSKMHYVGVTYQYQKFLSHAGAAQLPFPSATETQSAMFFYTLYLQRSLSFSLSGGPQYSDTYGGLFVPLKSWSPGGGGSVNWQGQHNAAILSYSRKISDGGGLQGAVTYNGADATIRHQFSAALNASFGADYSVNRVLHAVAPGANGGHSVSGSASLQRTFGEHFSATAGYLRLHQSYDIPAITNVPDRDRVWLTIGYQFQRPLGQ